jgi:hypothetical protein
MAGGSLSAPKVFWLESIKSRGLGRLVESSKLLGIRDPREPMVSSKFANNRAILLFHPCLIVLPIRARTRELQPGLPGISCARFD